jgi:hypothetical protein
MSIIPYNTYIMFYVFHVYCLLYCMLTHVQYVYCHKYCSIYYMCIVMYIAPYTTCILLHTLHVYYHIFYIYQHVYIFYITYYKIYWFFNFTLVMETESTGFEMYSKTTKNLDTT